MTQEQLFKNLQVPAGRADMILDTDAYNEIDDQFAIAYALRSPEKINTVGICAAPFLNEKSVSPEDGMLKSFDEIHKIVDLCGCAEQLTDRIFKGSRSYLPDESTPVESEAADFIVKTAMRYTADNPLYVVAIGAITNVASAIIKEPAIKDKIVIVWLGGHALHWSDTAEFNMRQDVAAARVVFGCGAPLIQLPCMGVVSEARTTGPELTYWLKGENSNPLSVYLADNTIAEAESYAKGSPWSRVIWDITAVAWLINDDYRFLNGRQERSPIPEYDDHYGYDSGRHFIFYVDHVDRDALFADLFEKLLR